MKSYRTLALKELLSQKVTSILILIAVVLSTMMTTIVGQSIGVLSAMREQQAIAIGGNRYATFLQMNADQLHALEQDERLSYVGKSIYMGSLQLSPSLTLGLMEYLDDTAAIYPSSTSVEEGRLPEAPMEIALSEDILKYLGFEGGIGDKITLSLQKNLRHNIADSYSYTAEFVLTGILKNNYLGYTSGTVTGVVGKGTAEQLLTESYIYYNVDIRTADKKNFQAVVDDINKELNIHELDTSYNIVYLNALGISYTANSEGTNDKGLNQKKEQSQLDDADKVLAQMTKARRGLIKEFYNAAESGKFDKNKCPLCGTDFTDIDSAIIETERFIKNIHTDGIKIIEDIETQITNLFQKEIIPVLKVFLEENKVLIKMDDTLSGCKNLAVEKLQQLLDKVKISEFKSQGIEKFDIEEFSQQYENLLKELQEKEVPNKIIFQEKQVELYKSIHNTYYHNEKPYHTVGELQSKEQYVAKLFNDNLSQQLSTEEARLRKLKRDYEEYKNKTKDMTDAIKVLVGKYEDANKEYQTQLLNAIKIPLMVYSGRIIQNYPLGLGIRAVIKTNQLVFEAASKSGSDVYNILSTGQLNGLSIALLLSIKNVYGDTKGLDILLIDDPLQTIDDISAISLADLLTQQGIGQIVLSTHEEAKAALLRYKFKHAGMSVREQNMQALYMKTVTEE